MKNQTKTILCVTIAGILFIVAVVFKNPIFGVIAAFFDWLPLPTGWMKSGSKEKAKDYKTWVWIHTVVTIAAYLVFIVWLFKLVSFAYLNFVFLLIWWLAVMAGVILMQKAQNI